MHPDDPIPEHYPRRNGMVMVDAYCVPAEQAAQYIADREALAQRATQAMRTFCHSVERCWAGSQDGEAVVGLNAQGRIQALVHLDPDGLRTLLPLSDAKLLQALKRR